MDGLVLYLSMLLVVGALCGALTGRLMRGVLHTRRTDVFTGVLGALAASSLAWWAGWPATDRIEMAVPLWCAGALWLTFIVRIGAQARQPGEWVALRARDGVASLASAHDATPPSPARAASRANPLLVLHDGHSLRCWPTGGPPGTRMHGAPERLDWTVEVDGDVEHAGPVSGTTSTSREVTANVRSWFDATRPTAVARVSASRGQV